MFILSLLSPLDTASPCEPPNKEKWLYIINKIRRKPKTCGKKRMKAATKPLVWNETLEYVANQHAADMLNNKYFSHSSRNGDRIGDRADKAGYQWIIIGENIAEGQKTINEVMKDWMESPSHCEMMMNVEVQEVGMAKVGNIWVQNFGTQLPPGAVLQK